MADVTVSKPYGISGRAIFRARADGNFFLQPWSFVPVTSYTTGGDTIATADMPGGYKDLITPWAVAGAGPYGMKLDVANKKIMVYISAAAGAVEVNSTTNIQTAMGTTAITLWFLCRS
jgi:hypothetical protein